MYQDNKYFKKKIVDYGMRLKSRNYRDAGTILVKIYDGRQP